MAVKDCKKVISLLIGVMGKDVCIFDLADVAVLVVAPFSLLVAGHIFLERLIGVGRNSKLGEVVLFSIVRIEHAGLFNLLDVGGEIDAARVTVFHRFEPRQVLVIFEGFSHAGVARLLSIEVIIDVGGPRVAETLKLYLFGVPMVDNFIHNSQKQYKRKETKPHNQSEGKEESRDEVSPADYSYNLPNPSISRLDELLNRNEVIYQNLKQKLDGINKSNQNIYKNINHIQTSFNDPFSQESSAIEKEPTIRNQSIKIDLEESIPKFQNSHHELERIDEHQEVTFSEDQNHLDAINEEMKLRKLIQQEAKLQELQILLERERALEEERRAQLQMIRRQREETERIASKRESYRQQKFDNALEQVDSKRETTLSLESKRTSAWVKTQKEPKNSVKNNSIYLNQIPKTSYVDTEEEIPTFRESFSKPKEKKIEEKQEVNSLSKSNKSEQIDHQEEMSSSSFRGKQLRELSTLKSNRGEEKPSKVQSQLFNYLMTQNVRTEKDNRVESNNNNSSRENQEVHEFNFENTMAKTQKTHENTTPYSELNSHFKNKLEEIELIPECYLFAPFNKVYRSPILQIKPGCLILQRKSKTTNLASNSRNKIVDGLRYKFKNVITDQQLLLKYLFCSSEELSFQRMESNKIAIVGGREVLKKKIHMGILAYCHQQLVIAIQRAFKTILIKLEHQSITPNDEPFVLESIIEADPSARKVPLMKLDKMINDIYDVIKKWGTSKTSKKILRMSKIVLIVDGAVEWSYSIISSNRYDYDFLRHLKVNKICWCINPLVKYYEDVKETLESMKYFVQNRKTA